MTVGKLRSSKSDPKVSRLRSELRTALHYQIDYAINVGCFLESISIAESLIADSLESFLQKREGKVYASTLKPLISRTRKHCKINENLELLLKLERWCADRDTALHEIAKVHELNQLEREERHQFNLEIALEGKDLVRQTKNFARRIRA